MSGEWRVVRVDTERQLGLAAGPGLIRDDRFDDYDTARAALEAVYERWRSATCENCVKQAAADEEWLYRVPRGAEFVGNVEGDDHLLIRSDRTDVTELWDERERLEGA